VHKQFGGYALWNEVTEEHKHNMVAGTVPGKTDDRRQSTACKMAEKFVELYEGILQSTEQLPVRPHASRQLKELCTASHCRRKSKVRADNRVPQWGLCLLTTTT
jgi:hypothetical protein